MDETLAPVAAHYSGDRLLEKIAAGIDRLGLAPGSFGPEELAPVDEFHIGGLPATENLVAQMGISPGDAVLDLGCGIGGPARYIAKRTGARVTGLDLTESFVRTGNVLSDWCGLAHQVTLEQGNALELPFEADSFAAAYMMHVGMNIADKAGLAAEVARVLNPGGTFAIYDVMQVGEGAIAFPVPWASTPSISALGSPGVYRGALEAAGFLKLAEADRTEVALAFFETMRAAMAAADDVPPLGLHLLMGEDQDAKVANMIENVRSGLIAPVEMIARLPGGS